VRSAAAKRQEPVEPEEGEEAGLGGEVLVLAGGAALLVGSGAVFVAQHGVSEATELARASFESFVQYVQSSGPSGLVLYVLAYALMELLLLPASPLALAAGAIFGLEEGTALSALGGLSGATLAFLLARYVLRERVVALARDSKEFRAIDRLIERDGGKVVLLVNMSPLAGLQNLLNYAYGSTSLRLPEYMLASGFSLLPRTIATVSAGTAGRTMLEGEEAGGGLGLGLGVGVALVSTVAIARYAQQALAEMKEE